MKILALTLAFTYSALAICQSIECRTMDGWSLTVSEDQSTAHLTKDGQPVYGGPLNCGAGTGTAFLHCGQSGMESWHVGFTRLEASVIAADVWGPEVNHIGILTCYEK